MYRVRALRIFIFVSVASILQGCGRFDVNYHHTDVSEVVGLWDSKSDGPAYTVYAVEAFTTTGRSLLTAIPKDIDSFCPGYRMADQMGRIAFWVGLESAIAEYESDFKPDSENIEKFKDSKGQPVSSRGLLQISLKSTTAYGCEWKDNDELYDPQKNIACSVKVLTRLVSESGWISGYDTGDASGDPWQGGARYWHVLRPSDKLGKIQQATRALQVCQS